MRERRGGGTAEVEIQGTRGKKNRGLQERKTGDCKGGRVNREKRPGTRKEKMKKTEEELD